MILLLILEGLVLVVPWLCTLGQKAMVVEAYDRGIVVTLLKAESKIGQYQE